MIDVPHFFSPRSPPPDLACAPYAYGHTLQALVGVLPTQLAFSLDARGDVHSGERHLTPLALKTPLIQLLHASGCDVGSAIFFAAIAGAESRLNIAAENPVSSAYGIMQVIPKYADNERHSDLQGQTQQWLRMVFSGGGYVDQLRRLPNSRLLQLATLCARYASIAPSPLIALALSHRLGVRGASGGVTRHHSDLPIWFHRIEKYLNSFTRLHPRKSRITLGKLQPRVEVIQCTS